MYLAMNRFRVRPEAATAFEEIWRNRKSRLSGVEGFRSFHLLRGPERADHVLYASHTIWEDEAAFLAWTKSEAFRAAHRGAGENRDLYLGPPDFEGFSTILAE